VGAGNDPRITTTPGGTTLAVGGTAGGQLTALTTTIPEYSQGLDAIARRLVTDLNRVHSEGFDAAGNAGGVLMDDGAGGTGTTVTAGNISLRITTPAQLAAASTSPADLGAISGDGKNADRFSQLGLGTTAPDADYRALVVALGVEASVAARDLTVQSVISGQVDAARESVSGVNLDEEMTSMLSFQHAYNAAARMVTAIDEALDKLINGTGIVGR
jgi:flagellar hook-associated protein 1